LPVLTSTLLFISSVETSTPRVFEQSDQNHLGGVLVPDASDNVSPIGVWKILYSTWLYLDTAAAGASNSAK
jgi:hypothetical protein